MKKPVALRGFVLIGICIFFGSCSNPTQSTFPSILPEPAITENWLLHDKIEAFKVSSPENRDHIQTGLSKRDYLVVIEKQVRGMQKYQDINGAIIDPVENVEKYYTTPCYAHSVAVLASSGHTRDNALIESGMRALDNVCEHLKNQHAPGNHGDFFTWPVVFAFWHFKSVADPERYDYWKESIANILPAQFYATYEVYRNNWNLVHAAGEFLRYLEGFTTADYIDSCLKHQLYHFTDYGMYDEYGNPLPYDLFSRHYLTGMLALGYDGAFAEMYKEILYKGAWMSLFMQSPHGELPTGYRSSHHIWNEAEQAMIFEIYASAYAAAGNEELAGAFKRGAMLSLQSIMEWIRSDGTGYIIKNRYPIEKKHGYESYSMHSCYNMLATSMLAQAWQFSDKSIIEKTSPADLGGYVLPILDPFHKVIASAAGTFLEYDTRGDQVYNPTGIIRIHLRESHPQLGPSDGCASKFSGEGVSVATGPVWKNSMGERVTLASQNPAETEVHILAENADSVSFRVSNATVNNFDTVLSIETITLVNNSVTIENELIGDLSEFRITWPMLADNGMNQTEIRLEKNEARLILEGRQIGLQVLEPPNASITRSGIQYEHRNGIVESLYIDVPGKKIRYRIGI